MLHFAKGHFCLLKQVLFELFATQYDMDVSSDFKLTFEKLNGHITMKKIVQS